MKHDIMIRQRKIIPLETKKNVWEFHNRKRKLRDSLKRLLEKSMRWITNKKILIKSYAENHVNFIDQLKQIKRKKNLYKTTQN